MLSMFWRQLDHFHNKIKSQKKNAKDEKQIEETEKKPVFVLKNVQIKKLINAACVGVKWFCEFNFPPTRLSFEHKTNAVKESEIGKKSFAFTSSGKCKFFWSYELENCNV